MKKYIFFAFVVIFQFLCSNTKKPSAATSTAPPVVAACRKDEIKTPSGCWSSCSASKYSSCGDIFPALYNPSFCAYTSDGRYLNYTFECQACKSTGVVAVRSGACNCSFVKCGLNEQCQNGQCLRLVVASPVDPCATVKCSAGNVCQNGQCVSNTQTQTTSNDLDPCATVKCSAGYACQNGQCLIDTQQMCQATNFPCSIPRPNEKTCPTRYYFVAPTPNFCGITIDGNQLDFPEECDACKNEDVQNYWNKPCNQIKPCLNQKSVSTPQTDPCASVLCIATTRCIDGVCVPLKI